MENEKMNRLVELVKSHPNSQYLLGFMGRNLPATAGDINYYENEEGKEYPSIEFWDSDTGNLFDIDYRMVPIYVFIDGVRFDL